VKENTNKTPYSTVFYKNMKFRLQRISPRSLAATLGIIYFSLGLIVSLFGIIAAFTGIQFTMREPVTFSGAGLSLLPLAIAYPFIAAFLGAIGGFLIAWVYNFTVRFTKGIQLEFTQSECQKD
jgi:hypothetical protein